MPWVAAAIAGGALIGNYLSNKSAQERAEMARNQQLRDLLSVSIPDPKDQQIALQRYVQTGELTPAFEQAIKAAPSEFNKIVVDQNQKAAQNRALAELSDLGNQGGLRLQDKAALQEAMMHSQNQDRGARAAILDDMNRRGQGGSGMSLQAQLQGQQATGDRNARSGLQVAASAQDRALQSLIGAGDLATKSRGQDFQEQSARAQANDAINRFNTQNLQNVNSANVGIANTAQARNLAERQRISDQNVGLSNQEQQYNKGLSQQQFQNQMQMAAAKNGVYTGQANAALAQGQQQGNLFSNAGQAGLNIYAANQQNDAYNKRTDAMNNMSDEEKQRLWEQRQSSFNQD